MIKLCVFLLVSAFALAQTSELDRLKAERVKLDEMRQKSQEKAKEKPQNIPKGPITKSWDYDTSQSSRVSSGFGGGTGGRVYNNQGQPGSGYSQITGQPLMSAPAPPSTGITAGVSGPKPIDMSRGKWLGIAVFVAMLFIMASATSGSGPIPNDSPQKVYRSNSVIAAEGDGRTVRIFSEGEPMRTVAGELMGWTSNSVTVKFGSSLVVYDYKGGIKTQLPYRG